MRRFWGFSLAEVMLSLALLVLASVLVAGAIPSSVKGTREAGARATAALVARQTLENLRAGDVASVADGALPSVALGGRTYALEVSAEDITASDGTPVSPSLARRVSVLVTWQDRANLTSRYEAGTILWNGNP